MEEERWEKEEIASHSSFLTNKRMDIILKWIDYYEAESFKNPCVPNIDCYFAYLKSLFNNIFPLIREEKLQRILELMNSYWRIRISLKEKENLRIMFRMIFICDAINRELKAILQNYSYFFRVGAREVRKIEDGLKIISSGGGIFEGVRNIPKDADELEGEDDK